ncbi:MAG: hypothetical protein JST59_01995 [Actinobacteria bacterium]|nr:hypothetical protein [Actinomycetota bacterium]
MTQHIRENSHKQCIRRNKFNGYILEAAEEFNNCPLKSTLSDAPTDVSKATIKKPEVIDLEGDDDAIVERPPAKRRKTQSAFIYPQERVEQQRQPVEERPEYFQLTQYSQPPLSSPADVLLMKQYLWNSMMMQMMMGGLPTSPFPYPQVNPMLQYSMYYAQAMRESFALMNASYNNI